MMDNHSNRPRGQSLVEFALIIPIFAALAFFIFDFGRGVYYYSAIYNAAREGARYGVTQITFNVGLTEAIENAIRTAARTHVYGIDPLDVSVIIPPLTTTNSTTKYLHVVTSYTFDPVIPFPSIDLKSEAIMRIELRVDP